LLQNGILHFEFRLSQLSEIKLEKKLESGEKRMLGVAWQLEG